MLELILMLNLGAMAAGTNLAQFQPCVWPNRCKDQVQSAVLAQFQPCVWPNRCADTAETALF